MAPYRPDKAGLRGLFFDGATPLDADPLQRLILAVIAAYQHTVIKMTGIAPKAAAASNMLESDSKPSGRATNGLTIGKMLKAQEAVRQAEQFRAVGHASTTSNLSHSTAVQPGTYLRSSAAEGS